MILAQNTYSSIDFYLSMPLVELRRWIEMNNKIIRDRKAKQYR